MDDEVGLDRDSEGRMIIRASGELDLATVLPLSVAVRGCEDGAQVVLDLSEATFLDSSVLALVAELHRRCEVSVVGAHGIVRRVFEISGMEPLLTD